MRLAIAIILLAFATEASAQSGQPHKLIVLRGNDGIAVTDYPSAARCEAARNAIQRLVDRANQGKEPQRLPRGGVIIPRTLDLEAHCIPG
jgi:hypothetical protein